MSFELGEGRGVKSPNFAVDEMLTSGDANILSWDTYQNTTDLLALLGNEVRNTSIVPSSSDIVLSGLTLLWSTAMTCTLTVGAAVSYTGRYIDANGNWGFLATSPPNGSVWSAVSAGDQSVAFDNGSSQDRIDTLQIRPVTNVYDNELRYFINPNTSVVTSVTTQVRREYNLEFNIKKGTPGGSPVAPTHDAGWIKIAEVYVPASISAIDQTKIKDAQKSSSWTTEPSVTVYKQVTQADRIPIKDAGSYFSSLTTKDVEDALQYVVAPINAATSSSTASTIIKRDASSRAQVADPSASQDIATKNYVDTTVNTATAGSVSATPSTLVKRDSNGSGQLHYLILDGVTSDPVGAANGTIWFRSDI